VVKPTANTFICCVRIDAEELKESFSLAIEQSPNGHVDGEHVGTLRLLGVCAR
jgi:hypothetical protein